MGFSVEASLVHVRRSIQWIIRKRYLGGSRRPASRGQNGIDRGTKERQVEDGVEELGFPRKTLERAVTQLQKELDDCHTEFEITRKLMPAPARNQDLPRPQSQGNLIGNSTVRYLKQLCVRMVGMM